MNDNQKLLADTCTRLFTDHVTPALIEAAEKGTWPAASGGNHSRRTVSPCRRFPRSTAARAAPGVTPKSCWRPRDASLCRCPWPRPSWPASILAEAGLDAPLGPMTVAPGAYR